MSCASLSLFATHFHIYSFITRQKAVCFHCVRASRATALHQPQHPGHALQAHNANSMEMQHVKRHPLASQPQAQQALPRYQANPLVVAATTAPVMPFETSGTMPLGWTQYIDDLSGHAYYVNDRTGESRWTLTELR